MNKNTNTNEMNTTNTIKKYENFSSFYKNDMYLDNIIKFLIFSHYRV